MSDPLYDEALAGLVSRAMELQDAGEVPDYASICAGHEHLIEAVRQACDYADALREAHNTRTETSGSDDGERLIAGRYRLETRLGSGAMGIVYRATDLELDRPVAVKLMRAFVVARDEAAARFEREAQALAAVQHPAVVTIHDRGVTGDGEPFLVMELLEGVSIGDLLGVAELRGERVHAATTAWIAAAIDAPSLTENSFLRAAVDWAATAAEGLHAAHQASLVHRDVKPSNLFLTSEGRLVLLDFGIASKREIETITRDGGPLGTPAYMAPESLDADLEVAPSIDIYGVTATLYHLLTLRAPFRGTPSQVLSALGRREPTPASKLRRDLPRDLLAILEKGMARDPGARYRSATELADDLRRFLDHRPVIARPVGAVRRVVRRARRSRVFWSVAATIAVAAGSLVAWGEMGRRAEQRLKRSLAIAATLPPQLTVAAFDNRRSTLAGEREACERVLGELVELGSMAPWGRVVRAMYSFDHDQREDCNRDLDEAARSLGTAFAESVARHYRELPAGVLQAAQVDLAALPSPETAGDHLLAAYLSLRLWDFERAAELLADARLASHPGAELMRMFVLTDTIEETPDVVDRIEPAIELVDALARLEQRIGVRLAWTRHMAAFGLAAQRRFGLSGRAAREVVEISPFAYGSAINAGVSLRRSGLYTEAMDALRRAAEIRPDYYKPTWNMVYVLVDAGDLDAAEEHLRRGPLGEDADAVWRRETLRGVILAERAIEPDCEPDPSLAFAQAACAAFEKAASVRAVKATTHWALAMAITKGNANDAFICLIHLERRRAPDARALRMLAKWLPRKLTANQVEAVRQFFHSYADRLDLVKRVPTGGASGR